MENFAQILQRLPTGSASASSSHSGNMTPFKVQVNFYIPIFEGQIDANFVDRWLNLLEGYFSVHDFSDWEKIIFALLKATPMSRTGGKPTVRKRTRQNPLCSQLLEFFPRCHQGTILSRGELWGKVHTMDQAAAKKGSRCAWANEFVPYPAHKVGYQRFRETFGAKVSQLSAQIHLGGNGVPWHLLAWYGIPVCCQDWAEIQVEEARLWICESKARERCFQTAEQRTEPRHGG